MNAQINFPHVSFPAKTVLFNKGDPADKFYIIAEGEVAIYDPATNRKINTLYPGESFGEQSILVGGVRQASAFAIQDTKCMVISTEKLRDMLDVQPGVLKTAIEALLLQLAMHNELKLLAIQGKSSAFQISDKLFKMLSMLTPGGEHNEIQLSADIRKKITEEVEVEKRKVVLKPGETLLMVQERLIQEKQKKILAEMKLALEKAGDFKLHSENIGSFLTSPQAAKLTSKDLLFLKLLDRKGLESVAFGDNTKILSPGDTPDYAYLITRGQATLSDPNLGFCKLGPGAIIGLAEGIANIVVKAEATAVTTVIATKIPIVKAVQEIRSSNSGLLGIARMTVMRVLELTEQPPSLSK
jgi:CRP-like cAMP-binding protein